MGLRQVPIVQIERTESPVVSQSSVGRWGGNIVVSLCMGGRGGDSLAVNVSVRVRGIDVVGIVHYSKFRIRHIHLG